MNVEMKQIISIIFIFMASVIAVAKFDHAIELLDYVDEDNNSFKNILTSGILITKPYDTINNVNGYLRLGNDGMMVTTRKANKIQNTSIKVNDEYQFSVSNQYKDLIIGFDHEETKLVSQKIKLNEKVIIQFDIEGVDEIII